jgi:hypothetical protein
VQAELKALHSPDVHDLERWRPPDEFSVFIQLLVGARGEPGEESFDVEVCSPGALREKLRGGLVMSGRHYIFMERYDYTALRQWIDERLAAAEGETWSAVASKLARIGHWEFEDYISYRGTAP